MNADYDKAIAATVRDGWGTVRVRLPNEVIIEVPLGECHVGGQNWPVCALGLNPHLECVRKWARGELTAERPVDPSKTFWPFGADAGTGER